VNFSVHEVKEIKKKITLAAHLLLSWLAPDPAGVL
jgi:hypothetical protein